MIPPLVTALLAYALGSLPFSYLVARWAGVRDIRRVGSGNVGATNVMRSAGRWPGLLALLLDAGKGALAVGVAQRYDAGGLLPALAATFTVIGHCYSLFLGLRGGKGVATGLGAFVPLAPLSCLGALAAFGVVVAATRYVSLASMAGAAALAALLFAQGAPREVAAAGVLLALLVTFRHRENIARLRSGSERRLGARP